jgi:lipid II:glycine glycyltransferase (peptidoglycan interpeptide bridge formation enzyme)
MVDLRQSREYARYLASLGWIVEKVNGNYFYLRRIPLTPFSIIKVQRPRKINFEKIDQLARKYRAIVIYLEPSQGSHQPSAISHQYHLHRSPFLPTKTIQIDLAQSEEKILAQMKKDARYSLRKARKLDTKTIRYKEIGKFHQAWKKSVSWRRHVPALKALQALKRAFGQKAIFLTTDFLAGTVVLMAKKSAYYFYAFTSKRGRGNFAQYRLVWETVRLAKKQGCQIFDFEGIYDQRFPQKSWQGFTHFKKSFGGKEVNSPGCLVKHRLPF